ncbi:hypothetical protein NDU88_006879 [Pleurodeles waltl]|uniref:Uncharacterized protein n=1 Tax=Pleurodeles waltl TaxID=8319 RepID=A0AAV7NTD1_PLEWA|nr:hypothetical protein NDU88_006879 [Pleurodeles waltl]
MAETANIDSHFNTPTATAVETNTPAVTANRQAEPNVPPTVLQQAYLPPFLGGTNAIKSTAETGLGTETTHLSNPTRNQDAMEPELQVLPKLVYLLFYQEQQRRR